MSFTSFPAFTSFPDLEPGPSSHALKPPEDKEERKRHKKSRAEGGKEDDGERKKRKRKHDKHKEREDGERHVTWKKEFIIPAERGLSMSICVFSVERRTHEHRRGLKLIWAF